MAETTGRGVLLAARLPVVTAVDRFKRANYIGGRILPTITTPDRIINIFAGAGTLIGQQMQLAHEIEQYDDVIRGVMQVRRSAVLRVPATVRSGRPGDPLADAAASAAEKLAARPIYGQISRWLLGAILQQWAAVELIWDTDSESGLWTPCIAREVEPWRWLFDEQVPYFYTGTSAAGDRCELVAGKYAIHSWDATSEAGDFATIRAVAKLWYLANIGLVDWGRMVDKHGMPVLKFTYAAGMPVGEIQAAVDTMLELSGQGVIAHPEGTTVDTEPLPDETQHAEFRRFYSRSIRQLLLGQESTTQVTEGQRTGAQVQADVANDLRDGDIVALDDSLAETFWQPWTRWNFGDGVPAPTVRRTAAKSEDREASARVALRAQMIGLPLLADELYGKLGFQRPDGVPDVLVPPEIPPGGHGGGLEVFKERRAILSEAAPGRGFADNEIDAAARTWAELSKGYVDKIKSVMHNVDKLALTDSQKFGVAMKRLEQLAGHAEGEKERADLLALAQLAAFARGAENTAIRLAAKLRSA